MTQANAFPSAEAIIHFWFIDTPKEMHFKKDPAFDAQIRERFEPLFHALMAGSHAEWRGNARCLLAAVLVLDQFSRNIFRDTPEAFSGDALALELSDFAIEKGLHKEMSDDERHFLYLPYTHAEDLAAQDKGLALYKTQPGENPEKWAVLHRDIIVRFGRFPHRNATLGRETTPEEAEFLTQPNSSF